MPLRITKRCLCRRGGEGEARKRFCMSMRTVNPSGEAARAVTAAMVDVNGGTTQFSYDAGHACSPCGRPTSTRPRRPTSPRW